MGLIFGDDEPILSADGDDVVFDNIVKRTISGSARATSHAIEKGATVQDNIQDEPNKIQLGFHLTETPLSLNPVASVFSKTIEERLELLKEWKAAGTLVSYSDEIGYYYDYAITAYSEDYKADEECMGSLTLSKVNIVEAQTEDFALPAAAKAAAQKGGRAASTAPAAAPVKSFARSIF